MQVISYTSNLMSLSLSFPIYTIEVKIFLTHFEVLRGSDNVSFSSKVLCQSVGICRFKKLLIKALESVCRV